MRSTRTITFCLLAAIAIAGIARPAAAADKYLIEVPVPEGVSVGSLSKMLKDLMVVLSKKVGKQIDVKEMNYPKGADEQVLTRMINDFNSGKADMALIPSPLQYMKLKAKVDKSGMVPFLALTMNNKRNFEVCAYVRSEDKYKSIKELKGKTWGGTYTTHARFLMASEGINVPMKSFFGSVKYVEDVNVGLALEALTTKKIDVYISPTYLYEMAKGANKKYSTGIRSFGCKEFEGVWFIVYNKKTVSEEFAKEIVAVMSKSLTDKDFSQFKFMMAAIKGKFVAFDPAPLKKSAEVAALFKKNNWEKEQAAFIKAKK